MHFYRSGTERAISDGLRGRLYRCKCNNKENYKASFKEAKKPASQISTAILMYSFGGQPKMEGKEGEMLPPGVIENELIFTTKKPDLDSTMVKVLLKELVGKCLYIHYDGVRYALKTIPNVNKLIEDEAEERIKDKKKSLNLQDIQLEQLKEKERTEKAAIESSLRNLYNRIWLLKVVDGQTTIS